MYTPQTAYEAIREFFTRPGAELAADKHGNCYYRHPEDSSRRCAVGCLIPDDLYDPTWEGVSAAVLFQQLGGPDFATFEAQAFLDRAQIAHDGAETVEDFLVRLDQLGARFYALTTDDSANEPADIVVDDDFEI